MFGFALSILPQRRAENQHEGHILDGWHRYRAAQELNLIRRLRFQEWNEDKEGDPRSFVHTDDEFELVEFTDVLLMTCVL